jgi:hypothetical protein
MERIVPNKIKRVQLMDASNNLGFRIPECVQLAEDAGLKVVMALTIHILLSIGTSTTHRGRVMPLN